MYFLEKHLAIPTSPFSHLLVNGFSVTCLPPFFKIEMTNIGTVS